MKHQLWLLSSIPKGAQNQTAVTPSIKIMYNNSLKPVISGTQLDSMQDS